MVGRSDGHGMRNAPRNEFEDLIGRYHDLLPDLIGLGCRRYVSRVVGCDQSPLQPSVVFHQVERSPVD